MFNEKEYFSYQTLALELTLAFILNRIGNKHSLFKYKGEKL